MEESEQFFRDLCENAHDLIQSISPEGRFLYVNRAWLETLGYTREQVESLTILDVIAPESRDHCVKAMQEVQAGREVARVEATFLTRDGQRVAVEGSASCRVEKGRPVATRGIFRDVTERNRVRDDLARHFDLSLDLLCVAGVDGFFKQINPAFEKVLGYGSEELLSRSFLEFVHPEDRPDTVRQVERLAGGLPVVDFQNRYLAKNGTYRWLAWRSIPVAKEGLIYAIARDITEAKRTERLIARQAEELARSNADLEQFAYVASHDLKAPLRAIANLAEWIEEDLPGQLPEKVQDHVRKLRGRVGRMEALTEDLLTYSRAGRTRAEIGSVDTAALVADLAQMLAPPAGFSVSAEPGMPSFETAKAPLEQVLRNLLGNALKHHDSSDGRITVSARDLGERYEFSVRDDGPGIPPKYQSRIFQMFQTLRPRDEVEGTGMGLALVKKIVERHGGEVRVDSGEGRGSTFRFTWPKRIEIDEEEHAENPDRR